MTPYAAGYTGEIRVSAPHPRSYRPDLPARDAAINWRNTAPEQKAYMRAHGLTFTGPAVCKPIPKPKGNPITGTPDITLPGQLAWTR